MRGLDTAVLGSVKRELVRPPGVIGSTWPTAHGRWVMSYWVLSCCGAHWHASSTAARIWPINCVVWSQGSGMEGPTLARRRAARGSARIRTRCLERGVRSLAPAIQGTGRSSGSLGRSMGPPGRSRSWGRACGCRALL